MKKHQLPEGIDQCLINTPTSMPLEWALAAWHFRQLIRAALNMPEAEVKPLYEAEKKP